MSWLTKYGGTPGFWGFAGAVLGAVTTIFFQWFLPWWRRPILVVEHRRDLEGVLVDTPSTSGDERYARIRVRNRGIGVAKNARCMIDRIVFSPADAAAKPNGEEVLDLLWVFAHDVTCDIPSKSHRWAELCHVSLRFSNKGAAKAFLKLGSRDCPLRYGPLLQKAGRFDFHVVATAENARTVNSIVRVKWDGTVAGLDIE